MEIKTQKPLRPKSGKVRIILLVLGVLVILISLAVIRDSQTSNNSTVQASPTTMLDPYIDKQEKVVLRDTFNGSNPAWYAKQKKLCTSPNGLWMAPSPNDSQLCYAPGSEGAEFSYEISFVTLQGNASSGIVFRADIHQLYAVLATANDGIIDIEHWTFDSGVPLMDSINRKPVYCSSFQKGIGVTNVLAVHVAKQEVKLFINHIACGSFTMKGYTATATTVGVMTFADLKLATLVKINQATVWS